MHLIIRQRVPISWVCQKKGLITTIKEPLNSASRLWTTVKFSKRTAWSRSLKRSVLISQIRWTALFHLSKINPLRICSRLPWRARKVIDTFQDRREDNDSFSITIREMLIKISRISITVRDAPSGKTSTMGLPKLSVWTTCHSITTPDIRATIVCSSNTSPTKISACWKVPTRILAKQSLRRIPSNLWWISILRSKGLQVSSPLPTASSTSPLKRIASKGNQNRSITTKRILILWRSQETKGLPNQTTWIKTQDYTLATSLRCYSLNRHQ